MAEIILGIESSCDDTSAAVLRDGVLLSNVIASQQVHKDYGGVVPELASRAHEQNIVPVVSQALVKAGVTVEDLTAIAFTRGPGLLGSLLVGTSFAKALSLSLDVPMVMVNDLQDIGFIHASRRLGKTVMVYQNDILTGSIFEEQRLFNLKILQGVGCLGIYFSGNPGLGIYPQLPFQIRIGNRCTYRIRVRRIMANDISDLRAVFNSLHIAGIFVPRFCNRQAIRKKTCQKEHQSQQE